MKKSIGLIEFRSIPRGIEASDTMLKSGDVRLILSTALCPGKFVTLISGDVGAVKSSLAAGKSVGAGDVVDDLVLANVHESVFPALSGTTVISEFKALGVVETFSCPSIVIAADAAAKAASVQLIEVRLARGLGGKGFLTLTGDVGAVQAAVSAAEGVVAGDGLLSGSVVIPAPHPELLDALK